jgi:hypothetical protein
MRILKYAYENKFKVCEANGGAFGSCPMAGSVDVCVLYPRFQLLTTIRDLRSAPAPEML